MIKKECSTTELIGCSVQYAREHLEKQFRQGMNWKNAGLWHIDHILPINHFDLTKIEEQKRVFHYTNLQPLWRKENISKSDRIKI